MTMADTVAVMNEGRIEQMGAPEELYEAPASTFVGNFLGQSNLVAGSVSQADGEALVLDVQGAQVLAGKARARVTEGKVWVGVRPEKVFLGAAREEDDGETNTLAGGAVSDVSFVGVSTQYLVRMPWGQELTVFEQNTGARDRFRVGDQVDLHWQPVHTFLLDASQDASAGVEREDE
jgi:spermidine/putrescine transport system ATP-binding protein